MENQTSKSVESENRTVRQIEMTKHSLDQIRMFKEKTGMTQARIVGQLVDWFMELPFEVQISLITSQGKTNPVWVCGFSGLP